MVVLLKDHKKIIRYLFLFICFTCLITIGEGCKSGNLTTSSGDPLRDAGVPPGGGTGGPETTTGSPTTTTTTDGTETTTGSPTTTTTGGPETIDPGTQNILRDSFQVVQSLADPQVDILVVIDTSGSMNHHQKN